MSDIRPFRALRFARDPEPRLAPPWDVIDDATRAELAREAENVVHLTLPPGPEGERDYRLAARTLTRWVDDGVLVRDEAPRIYMLRERVVDGRTRRGWLAQLRIEDYGERIVLPHEKIMPKAREDRLLLTREVRANLEPLFFLYEDPDAALNAGLDAAERSEAVARCSGPDGTELSLFAVDDPELVQQVRAFLAPRPVVIADGHHRYDTMLRYRDECRQESDAADAPYDFVLAYLVNAFDPGSDVRAIHRVVTGGIQDPEPTLGTAGFEVERRPERAGDELLELLADHRKESHAFVIARGPDLYLATRPRGPSLDVQVLHTEVLEPMGGEVRFDAEPERVLAAARSGEAAFSVLQNPLSPEELFRVVRAGALLPQKSTYFAPKIPSGLVLRDFS